MIAFHAPPFTLSTGRLRTVAFARHLPSFGWSPRLVTARESIYTQVDPAGLAELPPRLEVIRAGGFDLARPFGKRWSYPQWAATPDRWASWGIAASRTAIRDIRQQRPSVLWATFPIPSALMAAVNAARVTGVPLVVDLRDPIVYDDWPSDPWARRVFAFLERCVVGRAAAIVVTTRSSRRMYLQRYPSLSPERVCLVPNGAETDEAEPAVTPIAGASHERPVTLVHSGLMEFPDRDPEPFFRALALLRVAGAMPPRGLRVVLRASGREEDIANLARRLDVAQLVDVAPRVSRTEALQELHEADGLLVFQGRHCNRQIPAKVYEYLLARRPLVGLVDPGGDTYDLLANDWQVPYVADMGRSEAIAPVLERFFRDVALAQTYVPSADLIPRFSRRGAAEILADVLDRANRFAASHDADPQR
jgi:hypothetical protein